MLHIALKDIESNNTYTFNEDYNMCLYSKFDKLCGFNRKICCRVSSIDLGSAENLTAHQI